MADRFHEPYRKPLIPGSDTAERAARECGALAFVLSGAGPTFMCLTTDDGFEGRIRERLSKELPKWTIRPLSVDYVGATYELAIRVKSGQSLKNSARFFYEQD